MMHSCNVIVRQQTCDKVSLANIYGKDDLNLLVKRERERDLCRINLTKFIGVENVTSLYWFADIYEGCGMLARVIFSEL